MNGMMVLFHCESNPGYAASSHEHTFLEVAKHFTGDIRKIHFAYASLDRGMTPSLPASLTNVIQLDTRVSSPGYLRQIEQYIRQHNIVRVLGFDQPVARPAYQALRAGGVNTFVSYWGAPMSSINGRFKLLAKRIEVSTRRFGPDHYVFQSEGMRDTAVNGRGISPVKTSVIKTGIDTGKYSPDSEKRLYAHHCFSIQADRKVIVFSGHMEPRKGVHIILLAAKHLILNLKRKDIHFLILGNRPGEKERFEEYLAHPLVRAHVTFGGYRSDLPDILKSCAVGMIASTEWDSFPMSSLEMAATGLPILVSDLPGLNEAITDETGLSFPVGNYVRAAESLISLMDDETRRQDMGQKARERVLNQYSRTSQRNGLIEVFKLLESTPEAVL